MYDAMEVSMTLIRVTYYTYYTGGALYGDILRKQFITALAMLKPHRMGDLDQFRFTKVELEQLVVTNVTKISNLAIRDNLAL